ncbi:hypothetical protein J1605_015266 [Eschrichtius robustus]|uniref:Uncharacterized protein n=1 Tax=Eschrichtius robustus TaxID=9764 RepID=A0AB34GC51_ESCRO|nr:hypothetical protein J1605_015266 [Eschrichtius robustus]
MKPSGEDGAAQAGGPWEECFEAAAQLALRAGQVSAPPGARQAHSDLGQSGRRAWADGDPRGPGRDLGARAAEGLRAAYRTPVHLPRPRRDGRPGSRGPEARAGLGAQGGLAGAGWSGRADCLEFDPVGGTRCGCPGLEPLRVEVGRTACPRASGV